MLRSHRPRSRLALLLVPTCAMLACAGTKHAWRELAVGKEHTCAIAGNGALFCWGNERGGRLGAPIRGDAVGGPRRALERLNMLERRIVPRFRKQPMQVGTALDWTSVATGREGTCGVKRDGTLWCWGDGWTDLDHSQQRPVETRWQPLQLPGQGWTDVAIGNRFACGVRTDGSLWCWGDGQVGKLGNGGFADSNLPIRVEGAGWATVSAGHDHACALKGDGTLWCWGMNWRRQLGDGGAETARTTPHQVEGQGWIAVAAGKEHTCGLRRDGRLWCWGGTTAQRPLPSATARWIAVSADDERTCALSRDGQAYCWFPKDVRWDGPSWNDDRLTPLLPGTGWHKVAAGAIVTCAISADRSIVCHSRLSWVCPDHSGCDSSNSATRRLP